MHHLAAKLDRYFDDDVIAIYAMLYGLLLGIPAAIFALQCIVRLILGLPVSGGMLTASLLALGGCAMLALARQGWRHL
jgi:hypothetical protein